MVDVEIENVIRNTVNAHLKNTRIVSINIEEDVDHDDRQILRIRVVCDEPDNYSLAASELSGLVRNLRHALSDKDDFRFPLMSYVLKKELGVYSGAA